MTWFSSGLCSPGVMVALYDLKGHFQPTGFYEISLHMINSLNLILSDFQYRLELSYFFGGWGGEVGLINK